MTFAGRFLRPTVAGLSIATIAVLGTARSESRVSAQTTPEDSVEALLAAVKDGRIDDAAALTAEDVIWVEISELRFEAVGRPAFAWNAERAFAEGTSFELTGVATAEGAVTATVELTSDPAQDAGLESYSADFRAVMYGSLVGEIYFTFDLQDADTAEFVNALDPRRGTDTGSSPVEFSLGAVSPSTQTGTAALSDVAPEVVGVEVEVTPAVELQRTRIYAGTCVAPGDPIYWLADVLNGASFTLLSSYSPQAPDLDVSDIVDHGLILAVRTTADRESALSACGPLGAAPAPSPTKPAPTATPAAAVAPPATGAGPGDAPTNPAVVIALLIVTVVAVVLGGTASMSRR